MTDKSLEVIRWGLMWYSKDSLYGITRHLIFENCLPVLFTTRKEARAFNQEKYGYIKLRKDLRTEPHGWRLPREIRVKIIPTTRRRRK